MKLRGGADVWNAVGHSLRAAAGTVRLLDCILALLAFVAICGAPFLIF